MNRLEFEKYLGKMVAVKLFDGNIECGCLRKSHDEAVKHDANLYIPLNYYFFTKTPWSKEATSCLFKVSHVMKCEMMEIEGV